MVAMKRLTSPLANEWYCVVVNVLGPAIWDSAAKHSEKFCGQSSVSTVNDISKLATHCFMKILRILVAVIFAAGIALVSLEWRSNTTTTYFLLRFWITGPVCQ